MSLGLRVSGMIENGQTNQNLYITNDQLGFTSVDDDTRGQGIKLSSLKNLYKNLKWIKIILKEYKIRKNKICIMLLIGLFYFPKVLVTGYTSCGYLC